MQTVQIQCGGCQQVVGVEVENLGAKVQCPHCQTVIQVPDAAAFGLEPPRSELGSLPKLNLPTGDEESIFASSKSAGDDPFADPAPAPLPAAPPPPTPAPESYDLPPEITRARSPYIPTGQSRVGPIALMVLIPYCLATTAFIAYQLLGMQPQQEKTDPYERMPDPKPQDGPRTGGLGRPLGGFAAASFAQPPSEIRWSLRNFANNGSMPANPRPDPHAVG